MPNVNRTPLNTIPQSWAFDQEIGPWIRALLEQLRQLRERTGGDDDSVANLEYINTYETTALAGRIGGIRDIADSQAIALAIQSLAGRVNALQEDNNALRRQMSLLSAGVAGLRDELQAAERRQALTDGRFSALLDQIDDLATQQAIQ